MGQVEKFFVISIILLVIVVVGVTLFSGDGVDAKTKPDSSLMSQPVETGNTKSLKGPVNKPVPTPDKPVKPTKPVAPKKPIVIPTPAPVSTLPPRVEMENGLPFIVVRQGDCLGTIMESTLGSAQRYKDEVLENNGGLNENNLVIGHKIWLPKDRLLDPSKTKPAKKQAALVINPKPKKETETSYTLYKVKKGDSLWRIAQEFYGNGAKADKGVKLIKKANPSLQKNPDKLKIGDSLRIPQ